MNNEMTVETEWKDCNTNPPKNNTYKLLVHYIEDCFDESNYTIDLFDYINGDWFSTKVEILYIKNMKNIY